MRSRVVRNINIPSGSRITTSFPSSTVISPSPFSSYGYNIFPLGSFDREGTPSFLLSSSGGGALTYCVGGGAAILFFLTVAGFLTEGAEAGSSVGDSSVVGVLASIETDLLVA